MLFIQDEIFLDFGVMGNFQDIKAMGDFGSYLK
jgi:hypothetical protein